jgi:hypothetical protein
MFSWWNSVDTVTTLSTLAQWTVAVAGVAALVFSLRASALKDRADEAERQHMTIRLQEARARADDALAKQQARVLTADQLQTLIPRLQEGPKGRIRIVTTSGSIEAQEFADQFWRLFNFTGWTIEGYSQRSGVLPPAGLTLAINPADMPLPGLFLLHELRTSGLDVSEKITPSLSEGLVIFMVGEKP